MKTCIILLCLLLAAKSEAAQKYWVFFTDKDTTQVFMPESWLDGKAVERRLKNGQPAWGWDDLPVNPLYLEKISLLADSMGEQSRWLNACGAWLSDEAVERVTSLPFVREVRPMQAPGEPMMREQESELFRDTAELVYKQVALLQGHDFHKKGIRGKGVRIAVFDVGFKQVNEHQAFKHLFERNQIIETWDYIRKSPDVYKNGLHGTMVLSNIAGIQVSTDSSGSDTAWLGLAPDAGFLLARTERNFTEARYEEDHWVAAAEWAERKGADIITSSLGYTVQRYFTKDMKGISVVAQAATRAARKGVLVLSAAGNSGTDDWKIIATPGDADSVLTVGGVDVHAPYHINFSSYGPTADGRMKPNVVAAGRTWVASLNDYYTQAEGTSFATPLMAGFAACVQQLRPGLSGMALYKEIERSGHLYPYFDYAHGYGIPQGTYFLEEQPEATANYINIGEREEAIYISIKKDSSLVQNLLLKDDLLYYHLANADGLILKYGVVRMNSFPFALKRPDMPPNSAVLRVWFNGDVEEYKLTGK